VLRYAALILLALLIVLQIKLWTGAGGVRDVESLRETVAETRKANEALKARNEALQAEVRDLKEGRDAIEERARSELGLVKPGETFYQVVEPAAPGAAPPPQQK
jgi:cell division protein FtsB